MVKGCLKGIIWPKLKEKKAKVRIRPEAIVIYSKSNLLYTLTMIKADPDLKDRGGNISKIGRTQNGDLIVELSKNVTIRVQNIKSIYSARISTK